MILDVCLAAMITYEKINSVRDRDVDMKIWPHNLLHDVCPTSHIL